MEIRFKDGKPLMVGGGLIAGSQTCCCENPPPAACWCPDYCQYKIQIVSPEECAISAGYQCGSPSASRFTEPSLIQPVFDAFDGEIDCPGEVSGVGGSTGCGNYSRASISDTFFEGYGLRASAYSVMRKRNSIGNSSGVGGEVSYGAIVYCSLMGAAGNIKPQIFLQLDLRLRLFNVDSSLGELFIYFRTARKIVRIDKEECELAGDRKCVLLNDTDRRTANFQTPLEFTMSIETTSFGNYEEEALFGGNYGPYQDVLDSLLETEFITTFRITSRPSCRTAPSDCEVPLQGNRIIYFGTAADRSFVLGTPKSTTTGLLDGGVTVNYEHYGTAGGTTADPWVFNAKIVRDEDNRTIEEHNVELFCGLDESVSPAVSRWYVREFTYCTPEFGQQTTGQWISVVESYTASNDCNGIAVGDPVPIGSPDYEEVDGYPVVDFGDPCVPPAPIGLEITDLCP